MTFDDDGTDDDGSMGEFSKSSIAESIRVRFAFLFVADCGVGDSDGGVKRFLELLVVRGELEEILLSAPFVADPVLLFRDIIVIKDCNES